MQKGSHSTIKFLESFSNLLLGTNHELKNRYMHVNYEENIFQSINFKVPKYQFDTLECTLKELAVLKLVANTPTIKQKEIAEAGKKICLSKVTAEVLEIRVEEIDLSVCAYNCFKCNGVNKVGDLLTYITVDSIMEIRNLRREAAGEIALKLKCFDICNRAWEFFLSDEE